MASETSPTGRWTLDGAQEGLSSLLYEPAASSQADQLGPEDVLVEVHAASLNYRDLAIIKGKAPGTIPLPATHKVVPASDGAGVVVAVGSAVAEADAWLRPGSKVVTHMVAQQADDFMPTLNEVCDGLGQKLNGTLCRRGVFHRSCLVPMPKNLSFEEASTLSCSALTAWNALMGISGREVKRDDWVLVQGTGGVSVAALQIAVAAGANVVAITSSDGKAKRLMALGARHVVNYRKETAWGEIIKSLTPEQRGLDHVVDVVGPKTLSQSLIALRTHGIVTIAGVLGGDGSGEDKDPGMMSALGRLATYRGIMLGSRKMFLDLVGFVEDKDVKPALDDVVFSMEDAKGAFERLERREHFSKVIIKIQ